MALLIKPANEHFSKTSCVSVRNRCGEHGAEPKYNILFLMVSTVFFKQFVVDAEAQEKNVAEKSNLDEVVDWKCDSDLDCTANNSVCTNNTCQCPPGYIYNGEMTSCIEVAKYGEKCVESRQCSAYLLSGGSCVNNVCVCREGYYYFHGKCNEYTGLLQKCNKDDECYVHADFKAAHCDNGTCRCSPGFYQREYRTCRPEGRNIGDACTINNDCKLNTTAYCDNFACALSNGNNDEPETSFDGNISQDSYAIKIGFNTSLICTSDADCEVFQNATCSPTKTCTCIRAHFFNEDINRCVPEIGENCRSTDNAAIEGSECRNGTWTCQAGKIASLNNRVCAKATTDYKYSCLMDTQCSIFGPDAICQNLACICKETSRFIESELFCWTKRKITETCQRDMDCYVDGINTTLSCKNNVCSCPDGSHANANRTDCVEDAADLGGKCEKESDCATKNAACVNEVCVCKLGYYESNKQCLAGVNATCKKNEECTPKNSECKLGHCRCKKEYVAASTGLCMPVVPFGKPCENDVQCHVVVTDAICSGVNNSTTNKICTCSKGYHKRFNKCNKRKVLGMSCDTLGECYLDFNKIRVICMNGKCACDWGYERVDDTTCEPSSKTQLYVNDASVVNMSGLLSVALVLTKILYSLRTCYNAVIF
ncbi:uncharacterized protein LOC143186249 [Calliopsis andreniformis]|uniref:uncharacterized protein LOC143186249 n=1 Tax=Calliopsis andreniformis TaxID=337506 RepID=UPI003FCDDBCE